MGRISSPKSLYNDWHSWWLMYTIKRIHKNIASLFVAERHYSAVMPRLTKHFLGFFFEDELVGVLTLGWGTNPMGTIRKMFPELTTKDYFEIGKMLSLIHI